MLEIEVLNVICEFIQQNDSFYEEIFDIPPRIIINIFPLADDIRGNM